MYEFDKINCSCPWQTVPDFSAELTKKLRCFLAGTNAGGLFSNASIHELQVSTDHHKSIESSLSLMAGYAGKQLQGKECAHEELAVTS